MNSQKRIAFVSCDKNHLLASFVGSDQGITGKFFLSDLNKVQLIEQQLEEYHPDLVIVYQPEVFSEENNIFNKYFSVGYFTEQLPFGEFYEDTTLIQNFEKLKKRHIDLSKTHNLFIARNSNSSKVFESLFDIWQYRVLPVNDSLFQAKFKPSLSSQNHALFYGEMNYYTSLFVDPINKLHPMITNLKVSVNQIGDDQASIGLNLHCCKFADFEHEALLHMANGRLLLSQSLSPALNFKHGFSHIEFTSPENLSELLEDISYYPDSYESIRRYGFHATSRYKASKVWSEFFRDAEMCR